jgi:hypothetical protein
MLLIDLPQEIKDMIMLHLDKTDILNLCDLGISAYVWSRKTDRTLIQACKNGNMTGVRYLVDDVYSHIQLALRFSIEYGHLNIIKYLVKRGANIRANDNYVLRRCIRNRYLSILDYMIESGADINSALHISVEIGYLDVIKHLVETYNAADIHANGNAALHSAVVHKRLDIIQYLVEKSTNTRAYYTALRIAANHGQLSIVKYLVKKLNLL